MNSNGVDMKNMMPSSILTTQDVKNMMNEEDTLKAEIKRLGRDAFVKLFCDILSEQRNIVNPEELFFGGPSKDESTTKRFMDVYYKHQRTFHLAVFREWMPHANLDAFAMRWAFLMDDEEEFPKAKILEYLRMFPDAPSTPPESGDESVRYSHHQLLARGAQ